MLAFEFPPLAAVGVQRAVKLTKYLPEQGISPVVVTTDVASLEAWFGPRFDHTLARELAPNLAIHRIPCPPPAPAPHPLFQRLWHFFSLGGDVGRQWAPELTREWDRIVAQSRPAAVYVSVPPFTVAPLARRLARRSGLPLILDFRDHWSQWCATAYPTWFHYRADLSAERACVRHADAVLGVTGQLVRDLQDVHTGNSASKFHVVPNGWDGLAAVPPAPAALPQGTFVIGYVGSFYYSPAKRASVMEPWWRKAPRHWLQYAPRREDWLYRSPYFFFRALERLLQRRPELRPRLRVRFAGDPHDWFDRQVAAFGLQDVVEHVGRLSHDACLEFEARCDALLITSVKVEGSRDYCIAAKTFEYLAAGRPIIGIVTEGEQRDFLESCGAALVGDADDPEASARVIEQVVAGGFRPAPNHAFLQAFHSREASRQVAAVLRQLCNVTAQQGLE